MTRKPCHFTDRKGREWDLTLDLRTARYIDTCDFSNFVPEKFSILRPDKKLFWTFFEDSGLLFAIVWAIVQEQAESYHRVGAFPSPKEEPAAAELEFVSGINGKAREEGRQAFVEALTDFFPEQETVLSTLTRKLAQMRTKIETRIKETEPLLDEITDLEMDEAVEKMKKMIRDRKAGATSSQSQPSPVGPQSP
jgi:hypothetical protein